MGGFKPAPDYKAVIQGNEDYYWGMGLTAETVANQFNISREDQDVFAYESHQKALKAQKNGAFDNQIVPITIKETYLDDNGKKATRTYSVDQDEGPRSDTSLEALAKLRPVFANNGSVTAGNSSQTSDGAAVLLMMTEEMVIENKLTPIARLVSYATAGVPPKSWG